MTTNTTPGTAPRAGTDPHLAVTAALAGADIVRSLYGRHVSRVDKGAGDFATAADIAAERAIVDLLRSARPDDAVTGEESGRTGADRAERRWLVDPLCGTLNYAAGNLAVAVNVALRTAGRTTAAAVADPFTGDVFWTDGTGAYVRRGAAGRSGTAAPADEGVFETAVPSPDTCVVDVNLDPPFPHAPAFRAVDLLAAPVFATRFRPRVVSTTLAVAWVASGQRAGYVTDGGDLRGSVHFAAGIALCEAAGCVVTGVDGRPLDTSTGGLVAAADTDTHAALVDALRSRDHDRSGA